VSKQAAVLGVDVGTSSVKAALLDLDTGASLAGGSAPLRLYSQSPLQAEQDPQSWWDAAVSAVRGCLGGAPRVEIRAVGLTGQKHALAPADAEGHPLRRALLWADGRAIAQTEHVRHVFPAAGRRMGFAPHPGLFLPKWLYFQEREPALAGETRRLYYTKDFVRQGLTGVWATDRTEASASQIYDFRRDRWSPSLAAFFDLSTDMLAPVHASVDVTGEITRAAARATGLPKGIPVVAGAGDNEASALACGALGGGRLAVTLGTSGTVVGWSKMRGPAGGLVWNRHVSSQGYAATGTVLSAGRALLWIARTIFPAGTPLEMVLAEAEASDPGGAPLVFQPGLVGERSPVADPEATGAFVGLRPLHTRGHMARAVLEGVALAIGEITVLLRATGVEVKELRLTAGGAASPFWRRLIAAASRLPVRLVSLRDGAARGAAMLAEAALTGRKPESLEAHAAGLGPVEEPLADEIERLRALHVRHTAVRNALRGVLIR
jgi:xylulokinase